jgi:hypothetical protein
VRERGINKGRDEMNKGQKIRYVGTGSNYGIEGTFDRYTNAAKTRCCFSLKLPRGEVGFVGFTENLEPVGKKGKKGA